ncbi:uncharacterized protein PFL1_05035 [Pseudozyma flocculosa PF-1]|uniref:Uncharacterized protein n=2 Tax=Pseudozyma flocculosa TaxID=84751 RepID=A0A5C3EUV2_9BASI|nr:uncharacterized protein PFL1_05035 [Pseudozyma flocculosa PF-1]EPQ27497.1 hypothetical protein PFL1_05035 [Pseudozyma flocculosa PF-1]SPO36068.1 uncharacterized protein PSFLO_01539 [Pseudozyma flocculosa]
MQLSAKFAALLVLPALAGAISVNLPKGDATKGLIAPSLGTFLKGDGCDPSKPRYNVQIKWDNCGPNRIFDIYLAAVSSNEAVPRCIYSVARSTDGTSETLSIPTNSGVRLVPVERSTGAHARSISIASDYVISQGVRGSTPVESDTRLYANAEPEPCSAAEAPKEHGSCTLPVYSMSFLAKPKPQSTYVYEYTLWGGKDSKDAWRCSSANQQDNLNNYRTSDEPWAPLTYTGPPSAKEFPYLDIRLCNPDGPEVDQDWCLVKDK